HTPPDPRPRSPDAHGWNLTRGCLGFVSRAVALSSGCRPIPCDRQMLQLSQRQRAAPDGLAVEAQPRQPIEQRPDRDLTMKTCEPSSEAEMRTRAEGKMPARQIGRAHV